MAVDCPISGEAGSIPDNEEEANLNDLNSYMMVHHNLHIRQKLYCDRFSEHVVDYAIEWERVIVARVSTSLHRAERLRRDLDHYSEKVDRMKMEKSKIIAQGKSVDPKFLEKLARNDSKLSISREEYETYAADLTTLVQEVTARSWKDLHPILLKMTQFDSTLASDENQLLKNLNVVSNNLKKVANRYGLKAETRLNDLESLSAKLLLEGEGDKPLLEAEPSYSSRVESRSDSRQARSGSRQARSGSRQARRSGSRQARSGSKTKNEVVQEVVNSLVSKSTTSTSLLTPRTSHLGMSRSPPGSPRKQHGPSFSEMDKALDDMVHSPRSGSKSKSREFTGQPKQMNRQSATKSGTSDYPKSQRSKNRPSSRSRASSRNRSLLDYENPSTGPFDGLDDTPSSPRRQYKGTQRIPPTSPSRNNGQNSSSSPRTPLSDARANTPTRDDGYRKKWSDELVSSVEREEAKSSTWYSNFF